MTEGSQAISTRRLLAILATPPRTTGDRTRARVNLARDIVGADFVSIVNLFDYPTKSVLDIEISGAVDAPWIRAREEIQTAITTATDALLGYGHRAPNGLARTHHQHQVLWLDSLLDESDVNVWTVGGTPRHPSRWQRYTSRAYPELDFKEALRQGLELRVPSSKI